MSSFRKIFSLALVTCTVLSMSPALFAQAQRGTQSSKIPSPPGTQTEAVDLDDKGGILGLLTGSGPTTGFLFSQGVFTHFRFPGSSDTSPADINNKSVIVGSFRVGISNLRHVFTAHSGVFTEIKLPGFPNADVTGNGINDQGDITGVVIANGVRQGYLLHQGKLTLISFPGAQGGTFPASINNAGVIVGTYKIGTGPPEGDPIDNFQGFTWKNGNFTTIEVPDALETLPAKINDSGAIVGTYKDSL